MKTIFIRKQIDWVVYVHFIFHILTIVIYENKFWTRNAKNDLNSERIKVA